MIEKVLNLYDILCKGATLKDIIIALIVIFIFYALMTGRGLISRILQIAAIYMIGNTFYKSYIVGDYNKAIIESFMYLSILFAPIVIKIVYKLIRLLFCSIRYIFVSIKNNHVKSMYSFSDLQRELVRLNIDPKQTITKVKF